MSVLSTKRQPTKSELLASFTNGVKPDQELFRQEIAVQQVWAKGLMGLGILTPSELKDIQAALGEAHALMEQGQFSWREEDEDIHMNLERFVNERAQGLGKKMHAGRSRNDLIATTLKLHVADSCEQVLKLTDDTLSALVGLAEQHKHILIPGMTHLQNGQPIRWSHALLGHAWALKRSQKKLRACREGALSVMPLGAAALAGTTLPIDLKAIAQELGFHETCQNSYDAVGERDALLDFLQASAHLGVQLSRLAEDVIYWSSAPVGLVSLSPQWSTGSSIMPNKRNPDVAELTRAKASLWIGAAQGVLTLAKGVPTSYASDLHEAKEPYLKVVNDVQLTLRVFSTFLSELKPNAERAGELLNQGHILATEIANHLVEQKLPFREAYALVAAMVESAESQGLQVHQLPVAQLRGTPQLDPAFFQALSFESSVEQRRYAGGTSLAQVERQIMQLKGRD